MSLFSKIFYGVDLDEEQRRQDELDAQLRALNEAALEKGKYDQATFDRAEENRRRSYIGDVDGEVDAAFQDGLNEGAANIRGGIGGTINSVLSTPLKIIPWQLWIAGAVFGAWKLGLLKKILPKS